MYFPKKTIGKDKRQQVTGNQQSANQPRGT